VTVDHFYTTEATEMTNAVVGDGYVQGPSTARIFPAAYPGNVPLFRLWSNTQKDHFYTTNATEADRATTSLGYAFEGVAGYVYIDGSCADTVWLMRAFLAGGGTVRDHFYTTSLTIYFDWVTEHRYTSEGIVAYVLPA
jgi:hypothetical protein